MFHRLKDGLRAAGLDMDQARRPRRRKVSLAPLVVGLEDRRLPSGAGAAAHAAASAEVATSTPAGGGLAGSNSPADRFVIDQYQTILRRTPQPGAVDYWVGQLDRGLGTGVVHGLIANSPEARGHSRTQAATANGGGSAGSTSPADRFVIGQYQSILKRSPQPAEVGYWVSEMQGGLSRTEVHNLIENSPEHQGMLGSGSGGTAARVVGARHPGARHHKARARVSHAGTTTTSGARNPIGRIGLGTTGAGTTGLGTTGVGTTGLGTTGAGTTGLGTTATGLGTTGTGLGTTGTGLGTTGTGAGFGAGTGSTGTGMTGTGSGIVGGGTGSTVTGTPGTLGMGMTGTGVGTGTTVAGTGTTII